MNMENFNKILIGLVIICIFMVGYIVSYSLNTVKYTTDRFLASLNNSVNTLTSHLSGLLTDYNRNIITTNPYNECIRLFIEQMQKIQSVKFDYEQAKATCIVVLEKQQEKDIQTIDFIEDEKEKIKGKIMDINKNLNKTDK